ncbi:hypothetical protein C0J45_1261 [Silurus meridionalis]|nr:hypothetical protein C0J45_1261 [Silurus meridionalis]
MDQVQESSPRGREVQTRGFFRPCDSRTGNEMCWRISEHQRSTWLYLRVRYTPTYTVTEPEVSWQQINQCDITRMEVLKESLGI